MKDKLKVVRRLKRINRELEEVVKYLKHEGGRGSDIQMAKVYIKIIIEKLER